MNELEKLQYDIARFQLPLVSCDKGLIEFDLSYFKEQIEELEKLVKEQTLCIYNVDEFYKLRAKLNNFGKAINDEKKKVKNEYNKPYTEFEKQVKECLSMIESASVFVDEQLKHYEKCQEQLLREEYIELWDSLGLSDKVDFYRIENQKWYLKSCTKKNVLVEMSALVEKINNEVQILKNAISNVDELTEVLSNYYFTLDLGKELGEYTKWKNTIKAREIVLERVMKEPIKTIQEKEENVQQKYETLNQEIKANDENKQVQVIISFTSDEEFIDYVLNWLSQNHVKYNFRKNNI